jgi:hypothetical protein
MVTACETPNDVAEIIACPSASAVTVPEDDTEATVGFDEDQVGV